MKNSCPCRESQCIHKKRLQRALENTPSQEVRNELAQMFRALGDPTRMGILLALREGEMCVRDLAIFLGISESAVSHQLRLLRNLYMVQPRREGQVILYSLRDQHVEQIVNLGLTHFLHEKDESEASL